MTPRRRRIAAVGVGLAAAAAAVTANLLLLGQARSEDPMGRLSPALDAGARPAGTVTLAPGSVTAAPPSPETVVTTVPSAPANTGTDTDGDDDHDGRDHDDD